MFKGVCRRNRGLGLAVYVSAVGAMVILLSVLLSLSFQQSFFASAVEDQMTARNLAEAALQQAMVTVMRSPNQSWGSSRAAGEFVLVPSSLRPKAYGIVSFNPGIARDNKVAPSLNNLRGSAILPGALDRQVPLNTVQLVSRGVCGQSVKTLEMLFYVPPFPNALASEGPVRSRGGLLVGGVTDPSKFTGSFSDLAPEDQVPAHVISNSNAREAINLGPGAKILGNVGAVGGVVLDSSVEVTGMVRQNIERQPVPKLDLDALFTRLGGQVGSDLLTGDLSGLNLAWNAHSDSALTIHGDLNLDGGVLVVAGDLTVEGGIFGHGAIFVKGQTTVVGGAAFHATDQVALVSRRRITLNGGGKQSSFFQGMMYSDAEIVASDVTVLGCVIARGLAGLELNDVNLINSPVTLNMTDGLELPNHSDDDTTQIIIRVEARDPKTRKPLSYKLEFSGRSDQPRNPPAPIKWTRWSENVSVPRTVTGLKGYNDIRDFLLKNDDVSTGYAKDRYRLTWLWDNDGRDSFPESIKDPLREYINRLEGKRQDARNVYSLNLNPNEALGVLESSRVLLWREVPN
ncbi:hypothetical protein JST97_34690 [bacterium]|nr:hypothetical protein [bacterium]